MFLIEQVPPSCDVGVDENTIIDVLVRRSNAQRQQIKATYEKAKGKVRCDTCTLTNTLVVFGLACAAGGGWVEFAL